MIRTGSTRKIRCRSLPFEAALSAHAGHFVVVPLPNITNVFYGRDVGYTVERIVLDETTEAISATQVRRLSTAP